MTAPFATWPTCDGGREHAAQGSEQGGRRYALQRKRTFLTAVYYTIEEFPCLWLVLHMSGNFRYLVKIKRNPCTAQPGPPTQPPASDRTQRPSVAHAPQRSSTTVTHAAHTHIARRTPFFPTNTAPASSVMLRPSRHTPPSKQANAKCASASRVHRACITELPSINVVFTCGKRGARKKSARMLHDNIACGSGFLANVLRAHTNQPQLTASCVAMRQE